MKICNKCKEIKDISCFNKNKSRKDGLQTHCSDCNKKILKTHYITNKDKYLKKNSQARLDKKAYIDKLKLNLSCIKCGEKETCCLDFHHLESNKKEFAISKAPFANISIARILKEIKKCICVCSNCHRKIHAGIITV